MCLAVPGKVIAISDGGSSPTERVGTVDFQGNRVEVGLAFTPDAQVGSWVLVHAGYSLGVLDEAEARETWAYLREAELVEGEMDPSASAGPD